MERTEVYRVDRSKAIRQIRRQQREMRLIQNETRVARIMRRRLPGIIKQVKRNYARGKRTTVIPTPRWLRFQEASLVKRVIDRLLVEAGASEIRFVKMHRRVASVHVLLNNSTNIVFEALED